MVLSKHTSRKRQNGQSGRFVKEYSDEDFIRAVNSDDYVTANDVAKKLGCNGRIARDRLTLLANQGKIKMKVVGTTKTFSSKGLF